MTASANSSHSSDFSPASVSTGVATNAAKVSGGNKVVGGKKSRKKSRKMNGAAMDWVKFVVDVFNKNRSKNPNYKYKQAMRDASKMKKKNKTMKA